jgi:protein phosphatase
MEFYAISNIGNRKNNEDHYIAEKIDDFYLFGVADGLGGHIKGEYASKIALERVKQYVKNKGKHGLIEGIDEANFALVSENIRNNLNMGTTIVACTVSENDKECTIANIGDSRAYIINNNIWKTKDHNLIQQLLEKGAISKNEAINHPQRNVVTRAVGLKNTIDIDVYNMSINKSVLLFCSDGLSDVLNDKDIAKIALKNDPEKACEKLIKRALKNCGNDNITVVIVDFRR